MLLTSSSKSDTSALMGKLSLDTDAVSEETADAAELMFTSSCSC